MDRTASTVLATLVLVSALSGALGALAVDILSHHQTPQVEYTLSPSCDDHETRSGHHLECRATVSVLGAGETVEYVEITAVTNGGGFTETWGLVPPSEPMEVGPHASADRWGTGPDGAERPLSYGDWVIVSVVTSDGRTVVLERHQFACDDVEYRDACPGGPDG